MKTWKVNFAGRKLGAIGEIQMYSTEVSGENQDQAMLKLYDRFEHIYCPKFDLIPQHILDDRNSTSDDELQAAADIYDRLVKEGK